MKTWTRHGLVAFAAALLSFCGGEALAGAKTPHLNLPPACSAPVRKCGCDEKKVSSKCIKATVDLGETTPWTGSLECSLKIFADDDSPSIFMADSLHAVLDGYTFKRLGLRNLGDGVTPAEVVFSRQNGEPVHFVFEDGESLGRPDPGVHVKMDERLMMVDAEGSATTHDPVYYDLYVGDGSRRRFLAANATGALGQLVSITDARGVTTTPADMGVDIVYDSNGVRQYLTPSRLANVTHTADFKGYDVTVYPFQEVPAKDAQTGLYSVPAAQPVERFSVRCENDGKRAIVTVQKGGGEELRYAFDYAMGDWSLTRPSGSQELKERYVADELAAKRVSSTVSSKGERLERTEYNYKWESWGFAMTNKVEGFDGVTDTTEWTYYTSGNGKGQVKTELRQSGLLIQYAYDNLDRIISETRSGPDMMTEVTTYDYTPVDASDPVLPVDTRPRTVVKTISGIECERIYYVYSPLTNVVERVGTQGAAYGGTNVLRTVTTFYPVGGESGIGNGESGSGNGGQGGPGFVPAAAGFVKSIRHEDGTLDLYDYELASNLWTRTVTHLHEQSPSPVSGKTTRDITTTNYRGEILEEKTEAYIGEVWYTIARNQMTYNSTGKRITSENLAGQVTTTAWDCCHKVSETRPDGSTTTWDYDDEGRMIASSRLIPLDMTNVTWLTTCYEYDDLGRQVATWQTNLAAHVGLPATRTRYDQLGRVVASIDQLGNTTITTYSDDERAVSVCYPNGATRVATYNANGKLMSVVGSAVTPEFYACGVLPNGTRWAKVVQGDTPDSPRFSMSFEDMLDDVVREECSGFNGAVLATVKEYDINGRLIRTSPGYGPTVEYVYGPTGDHVATVSSADGQWRKTESDSCLLMLEGNGWNVRTNVVTTSDPSIAPLVSTEMHQLTGLTAANPARMRNTDVRGNAAESEMLVSGTIVADCRTVPSAAKKALVISRYGAEMQTVSHSAVTNSCVYDFLGRQVAAIDGRGGSTLTEYNAFGQCAATVDALGNRTTYAYDRFGNLASSSSALGVVTTYEYDIRGNKTYEGGSAYPVRYEYDVFGNKATMTTYRDESSAGDTTTWLYDEASNCMTNKVYADGNGPAYHFSPDCRLSRRVCARGVSTEYFYDGWGNLTNIVYSDGTPSVTFAYDALGRQTEAHDVAGTTGYSYDSYGLLTSEVVVGVAGTNEIERLWDVFGRPAGYAINGARQTAIGYDAATGRMVSMLVGGSTTPFEWSYEPSSDLKANLVYPNGLTAAWRYDANRQLIQVRNAAPVGAVSQYDYSYDEIGRRSSCMKSGEAFAQPDAHSFAYNLRSELTNAVAEVDSSYRYAYAYDDIGNRKAASERRADSAYSANRLNQYLSADGFAPHFDADGNQTLIRTSTGVWSVAYNAEDRPVLWTCGATNITMKFDHIGRRVECLETVVGGNGTACTNAHHRFVYDGFLCIQRLDAAANNATDLVFVWDPTEPVESRPLVIEKPGSIRMFAVHDGSKNVSELIYCTGGDGIAAHYEYAPFGALTASTRGATATGIDYRAYNPFRFSSEYADDTLGLVYYNYRHYDPASGRWISREKVPAFANNLYAFLGNAANSTDCFGLYDTLVHYYLMYGLMRELGYNVGQAKDIAAGSQYPDTRKWDAKNGLLRPSKEQARMRELLHNLNSLRRCGILAFRVCLARLIKGEKDLFLQGVYLHVLADTYAHVDPSYATKKDPNNIRSYGSQYGHTKHGTKPDDVQWEYDGKEIGKERLNSMLSDVKKAMGKENTDTPDMDALLEDLYAKESFFGTKCKPNEKAPRGWRYSNSPGKRIPNYARMKGLPRNIDPNNPYGKPEENDDLYSDFDDRINERVIPRLEKCLDEARTADKNAYGNNSGVRR